MSILGTPDWKNHRVIVTGSRTWGDRQYVQDVLADVPSDVLVIVGYDPDNDRPRGVDRFTYQEAQKLGLHLETHPADWGQGVTAGFIRNAKMVSLGADLCLAFWDGKSNGTLDTIERATKNQIPVRIIPKESMR